MATLYRLVLAALFAAAAFFVHPQTAAAKSGAGGVVDPSTVLGFGTRPGGMGNAYVALCDDATSVYWNPAALDMDLRKELFGQYSRTYFDNTSYNMAAYKHPIGRFGTLGGGFIYEGVAGLARRDVNANNIGTFGAGKMNVMFSYGKYVAGGFSVGASIHVLRHQIAEFVGNGVGLDVGARYRFGDRLAFGLNVQNLVRPAITLKTVADKLPTNVKFGTAYTPARWLRFAFDVDLPSKGPRRVHSGMEWQPIRWMILRTGLDHDEPTFGIGFKYQDLKIDYSYKPSTELDNDFQRVSFAYEFGKSRVAAPERMKLRPSLKPRKEHSAEAPEWKPRPRDDTHPAAGTAPDPISDLQAAELSPEEKQAESERFSRLAEAEFLVGHLDKADAYASTSLSIWPSNILSQSLLGRIAALRRRVRSVPPAVNPDLPPDHGHAETPDPDKEHAQILVDELLAGGDRYLLEGKPLDALSVFRVALDVQPGNAAIRRRIELAQDSLSNQIADWLSQAKRDRAAGRMKAAEVFFEAVLKTDPGNREAGEGLDAIREDAERQARLTTGPAAELFKKAEEWTRRAKLAERQKRIDLAIGRYKKALGLYKQILKSVPDGQIPPQVRDRVKRLQSDIRRMERPWRQKIYTEIKKYIYSGLGHYRAGRLNEAIADWDRALALDSIHAQARELVKQAKGKLAAGGK